MRQVHVLASGSTGNATYIALEQHRVLVDAGISCRRIAQGMQALGVDPSQLEAVLISHEHSDHIRGLEVFSRRYHIPVYARAAVWESSELFERVEPDCRYYLEDRLELGDLQVECVPLSHDAVDPVGFTFCQGQHKLVSITDTGCFDRTVEQALTTAEIIVLESNHDVTMLQQGPYPPYLKKRILSRQGHLSNDQCGQLLTRSSHFGAMVPRVLLAHLSQHNNEPALAQRTVEQALRQQGIEPGADIHLQLTHAEQCSSVVLD